MDKEKALKEINSGREKKEAAFVFCLWKDPSLYGDYLSINDTKNKRADLEVCTLDFYFTAPFLPLMILQEPISR